MMNKQKKEIRLDTKESEEYMMNYADELTKTQIEIMKRYLKILDTYHQLNTFSLDELDYWAFRLFCEQTKERRHNL